MKIVDVPGWKYFVDESRYGKFDPAKVGKWMFFYKSQSAHEFAAEKCREAVERGVICESKVSDNPIEGVSCFYLNCDDMDGHKGVIQFFLDNNMISRTKNGRLYNISFKLDRQTINGEYGQNFKPVIKLDEFIDLNSGKWLK